LMHVFMHHGHGGHGHHHPPSGKQQSHPNKEGGSS
jgi:hypothetical protein